MSAAGSSSFLNQLGLGNFDLGFLLIGMIVVILILVAVLVLLILQIKKTKKLQKRLDKFLLGKDGKSLEDNINMLYEDNKFLKTSAEKLLLQVFLMPAIFQRRICEILQKM